ncbi:MAG TPA: serine hydrolase, partial [Urbifossiella sp.]|nr:serine hydrolase [Urbifossiella sp.]
MRTLFALALALAATRAAAAEPVLDAKQIDAVVEAAIKEFQAPGAAVVVVQDDKVVHLKGYGVRRLGGDAPVTPDTVFP